MKNNTFKLNSFIKDVEKDIAKAEKAQLRKAANLFKRKLRSKIRALGLVDQGNLLKGISSVNLDHASLVGISAPGFQALILEYGTAERTTLGKGEKRKGIRSTGKIAPTPYFTSTLQESLPEIQKILSDEWL